jgi:para-aminobenzoate N-oxygenase AurF
LPREFLAARLDHRARFEYALRTIFLFAAETLNTIDTFAQRYLREWDRRATVRTRPRYRLPADIDLSRLFPIGFQPIAQHEAVVALGEKVVHELLARAVYLWQATVADLEVDIVADLCGRLAGGTFHFPLPASVRQVARTIGVDEFYHAYAAREFIADLRQHTGIDPDSDRDQSASFPLATALASVRSDVDPAILGDAEIMVLCFAENFVTEELFGLVKNTEKDTAFHITLREHLVDEGRHQTFFQMLMRHIWQEIDEATRTELGRLLPGFLDALVLDRKAWMENDLRFLGRLGFDRKRSLEILRESYVAAYGERPPPKHQMLMTRRLANLLKVARIDTHGPTRDALVRAGWIDDQTAVA